MQYTGDPVIMHGWFVCPTVSMVSTSHAAGLEKTLCNKAVIFCDTCLKTRLLVNIYVYNEGMHVQENIQLYIDF